MSSASSIGKKSAFLFVGQGAQTVGMTSALLENAVVANMYAVAEEILGYDLKKVVMDGPDSVLAQTIHAQPALLIADLAAIEQLKEKDPDAVNNCSAAAGLSLGEYPALVHAGALTFEEAMRLVKIRATTMQEAGEVNEGTMATVIGVEDAELKRLCEDASRSCGEIVTITNYLFPKGRVVAGNPEAVALLHNALAGRPATIFKPLTVSGAFHTELMNPARNALVEALKTAEISMPKMPVIANITGKPYGSVEEIRVGLASQVTEPVLWQNTIEYLLQEGTEIFYDMGPRSQLRTMIRKIDRTAFRASVSIDVA